MKLHNSLYYENISTMEIVQYRKKIDCKYSFPPQNVKICFLSIGGRRRINGTVFQFALHCIHTYPHAYIHIHTPKIPQTKNMKEKAKNQKSKHPQTASILRVLTKRTDPGRKCKMQNQMTKKC